LVSSAPRLDTALIKAIVRAHQRRRILLDSEVNSIETLAKRFGQNRGHTARRLNLAFLRLALARHENSLFMCLFAATGEDTYEQGHFDSALLAITRNTVSPQSHSRR